MSCYLKNLWLWAFVLMFSVWSPHFARGQEIPVSDSSYRFDAPTSVGYNSPGLSGASFLELELLPSHSGILNPPGLPVKNLRYYTQDILRGYNPYQGPAAFTRGNFTAEPFGIHYGDMIRGGDIGGIRLALEVTDRFRINTSAYYSNAYSGRYQPGRYSAGAFNLAAEYKLHDRIYLVGAAQVSTGRNLHPAYQMDVGLGNYYGGGLVFMITEHFGIMYMARREYIRGKWVTMHSAAPVIR